MLIWSRAKHQSPDNDREDISKKKWGFSHISRGHVGPVNTAGPVSSQQWRGRMWLNTATWRPLGVNVPGRSRSSVTWLSSTFLNFRCSKQTDWFEVLASSFCGVAIETDSSAGTNEKTVDCYILLSRTRMSQTPVVTMSKHCGQEVTKLASLAHTCTRNTNVMLIYWGYGWCHILDSSEINSQR